MEEKTIAWLRRNVCLKRMLTCLGQFVGAERPLSQAGSCSPCAATESKKG